MTVPQVMMCPDGHYRRVIFEIGPFIADYPEQVLLTGIVQGWCPKCFTLNLSDMDVPRFREMDDHLCGHFDRQTLWDAFGIIPEVMVSYLISCSIDCS